MRASTAVAILFAAAAASPSLAAPHYARSNAAELLLARQNGHVARSEPVYNVAREVEDLMAREDIHDLLAPDTRFFSGSKRELVELMARQNIDPNDASGAGLLSFLGPLIGGIFGGGNKRELLEVFARELENSARSLNALD
ncbi:hypothetical protein BDY19DRAFT_902273 [Irpex rosettiformis]|uniref:Uncharacterized protein n=1 Tax=Irpex rosettiformis TaxID=378272 RepID=A0ACB8ULP4_9APHY|nr:hypothetical protein BDY19DRAFT_902273 [Irpex rosettiformis]